MSSTRGVADALTAAGNKADDETIGAYIDHLCDAFAFYKVRRCDIRGKKVPHFRRQVLPGRPRLPLREARNEEHGLGRVYENMVAIELTRRGWEVYAGALYGKEIGFVAMRRAEKVYI